MAINTVIGKDGWGYEKRDAVSTQFVIKQVHDFAGNC
jgi:hypothetical protein